MNLNQLLNETFEEYKLSPVDILGIGDAKGEYVYLQNQKSAYLRTLYDINEIFKTQVKSIRILEIGSFLGPVSISLKKVGFDVYALDIPEFNESTSLRAKYNKYSIPFEGINLRKNKLPYEEDFFDMVIICEVIEHLNFNPLPIFQEINRILKKGGHLYIAMPNQANFFNRLKLIRGKSIHNPIAHYFSQLDRNDNMIIGLHWREFTLSETLEIIEKMGFQTLRAYYFSGKSSGKKWLKSIIKSLIYIFPTFRSYQVVISQKQKNVNHNFWLTEANS
jgi:SAM-dependent methyltransferase